MEKVKRNVRPRTGHKGPEGEHSSTLSLASTLEGVGNVTPRALYSRERHPVPVA